MFYKKIIFFCFIYKMDNATCYQRNRDAALNKAKEYYKNNNKRLKKQARGKYRNLSEEDKNEKKEYGKNRYHMSEEKKQKLKEYQRKYQEAKIVVDNRAI